MEQTIETQPRVLIVDDDPSTLTVMSQLFEKAGAAVTTAPEGISAVKISSSQDFDLIMLDVRMPQLSGISAASMIRERGYKGAIVIATVTPTGHGRNESQDIGINAYFDKRVLKPKLVEALLQQYCGASQH